jgi:hypothetical protein
MAVIESSDLVLIALIQGIISGIAVPIGNALFKRYFGKDGERLERVLERLEHAYDIRKR